MVMETLLIKMLPEQINVCWTNLIEDLKRSYIGTQKPNKSEWFSIYYQFMSGKVDLFVMAELDEKGEKSYCGMITGSVVINIYGTRTWMIQHLIGTKDTTDQHWAQAASKLQRYVRSLGCKYISGITKSPLALKLANSLKFKNMKIYTHISWEV